jgi:hypothetical protein
VKILVLVLSVVILSAPACAQIKHAGTWKMKSCTMHGDKLILGLAGPSQMTVVYDNRAVDSHSDCGDFEIDEAFVRMTQPFTTELHGQTVMCPEGMVPTHTDDLQPGTVKYEWDLFCAHIVSEKGPK